MTVSSGTKLSFGTKNVNRKVQGVPSLSVYDKCRLRYDISTAHIANLSANKTSHPVLSVYMACLGGFLVEYIDLQYP